MSQPLLHAEGISVRRGRRLVLEPCDVTIRPGEVIGIYGPNGAGKSTLLQALAGLLPLASGYLRFDGLRVGRDLSVMAYRRHTAAVFQEPLLLRGTVGYNIALGLSLRGMPPAEQAPRVASWLERLQIGHLTQRRVGTLSGVKRSVSASPVRWCWSLPWSFSMNPSPRWMPRRASVSSRNWRTFSPSAASRPFLSRMT